MLRRASYKYNATPNANEEDGVEDLSLIVDLEGGKEDAPALLAAQVVPAASATLAEEEDGLTWTDDYFSDRTDVVAAFDFNQDEYASSKNESESIFRWICSVVHFSLFVLLFVAPEPYNGAVMMVIVYSWFVFASHHQQIVWIPHLAVTTTGVRYVEPPEKESCFLGSTVHIPLEAIDAIEVDRAASIGIRISSVDWSDYVVSGAPRGLHKIRRYKLFTEWKEEIVENCQDCEGTRLDIKHLREPYRFKKLVMSLKQQQQEVELSKKEEEADSAVV